MSFVFSRPTLLELAWLKNPDEIDEERTVDVQIRRLCAKLGQGRKHSDGARIGYALDAPKTD